MKDTQYNLKHLLLCDFSVRHSVPFKSHVDASQTRLRSPVLLVVVLLIHSMEFLLLCGY